MVRLAVACELRRLLHAPVALTVGPWTLGADLRTWIDEGLMTLFFLVVGLEVKRERDLGELREGRRLTVPVP